MASGMMPFPAERTAGRALHRAPDLAYPSPRHQCHQPRVHGLFRRRLRSQPILASAAGAHSLGSTGAGGWQGQGQGRLAWTGEPPAPLAHPGELLSRLQRLEHREALKVRMRTASDCRLAISYLPWLAYDAAGGGGSGTATRLRSGRIGLEFDPEVLIVPPLDASTTRLASGLLRLPLLRPLRPLRVHITPRRLTGWLDPWTGDMQLQYDAHFSLSLPHYAPPPLEVCTLLTTGRPLWPARQQGAVAGVPVDSAGGVALPGAAVGAMGEPEADLTQSDFPPQGGSGLSVLGHSEGRKGGRRWGAQEALALQGTRVDEQGRAVLVGVATVPRTSHWPTDLMLRLPAEATAVLHVEFLCS